MSLVRTLFALTLILGAVTIASAADLYVDNVAGDDRHTGEMSIEGGDPLEGPVRTIGRALRLARMGDTIHLADTGKPYEEAISLVGQNHSGYQLGPFTIEGNGAVLDGSALVPSEAWENYRGTVFRFKPRLVGHQQLFVAGRPAVRVIVDDNMAKEPPALKPREWCLLGGYIYFRVEKFRVPEDYEVRVAARPTGVTLFHVQKVRIANLTIQGFQLDGVNAFNSAREIVLDGVTCRGNGRAGVTVGSCSEVSLNACLLGDNADAQLLTQPISKTWIMNSELLSNSAPAWMNRGGEVHLEGEQITEWPDAN